MERRGKKVSITLQSMVLSGRGSRNRGLKVGIISTTWVWYFYVRLFGETTMRLKFEFENVKIVPEYVFLLYCRN